MCCDYLWHFFFKEKNNLDIEKNKVYPIEINNLEILKNKIRLDNEHLLMINKKFMDKLRERTPSM